MRSKAYDHSLLLDTHLMVLRLLENFLWALEVDCFEIFRSQKVAENMDFGVSNWILGNLNGESVHFMTYYTYSTGLYCK